MPKTFRPATKSVLLICGLLLGLNSRGWSALQGPPEGTTGKQGPQVKINYLNVCTPPEADAREISLALSRVPKKLAWQYDFEVAHGRSKVKDSAVAHYVRLRREFENSSSFLTVQYSLSVDEKNIDETLTLRARDPKDVMQISIESRVSATAASAASVISADTPATRVSIERFGKQSLGLARCPEVDQEKYRAIFDVASALLARYRAALGVRSSFRTDFAWLNSVSRQKPGSRPDSSRENGGVRAGKPKYMAGQKQNP